MLNMLCVSDLKLWAWSGRWWSSGEPRLTSALYERGGRGPRAVSALWLQSHASLNGGCGLGGNDMREDRGVVWCTGHNLTVCVGVSSASVSAVSVVNEMLPVTGSAQG